MYYRRSKIYAYLALTILCSPPVIAEEAYRPLLLIPTIDGVVQPEASLFLKGEDEKLLAPPDLISVANLDPSKLEKTIVDGSAYFRIDHQSNIRVVVDEVEQTLLINFSSDMHLQSLISLAGAASSPTLTGRGGFLNYIVSSTASKRWTANGFFELVAHPLSGTFTTSAIALFDSGSRTTRLDTVFVRDWSERLQTLRIGDTIAIASGGIQQFRFGGFQFTRGYETVPSFNTLPLPTIAGSAELPSNVDLLISGRPAGHLDILPGPFVINNLPTVGGAGTATIVVNDILGRSVVQSIPFYTTIGTLRGGLYQYSFEGGAVRRNYGAVSNSYGPSFAGAMVRYGAADWLTLEGRGEVASRIQDIGVGTIVTVGSLGAAFAHVAVSQNGGMVGSSVAIGIERRASRISFGGSIDAQSSGFRTLGRGETINFPKKTAQLFGSVNLGRASISSNSVIRFYQDGSESQIYGVSVRAAFLGGAVSLSAQRIFGVARSTTAIFTFTKAFGSRRGASADITSENGRVSATLSAYQSQPLGVGVGGSIAGSVGRNAFVVARAQQNTDAAVLSGEFTADQSRVAGRFEISGSLVLFDGGIVPLRPIYDSYASVNVANTAGVRVFADERLVGRTNSKGYIFVPDLRSFDTNRLRIEPTDVPLDQAIGATTTQVRPARRAGVRVKFNVNDEPSGVFVIAYQGTPVEAGSTAQLRDGAILPIASGGRVLLPIANYRGEIKVDMGRGRSCTVSPPVEPIIRNVTEALQCR